MTQKPKIAKTIPVQTKCRSKFLTVLQHMLTISYHSDVNSNQKLITKTKIIGQRRIAEAGPFNSSFVFAKWQHRTDGFATICNYMFWPGV